jgi:FtsP/CotA-like multicopper oxidase with cupredoxin domain
MNRRDFLSTTGLALAGVASVGARPWRDSLALDSPREAADYTLHIAQLDLELAPRTVVRTTAYNGAVPGPLIRVREGQPVSVDVTNDTGADDWVHWHGLFIPSDVDGSGEEGTPPVPAHGVRRYTFTPRPAGTRWYHSHRFAGHDLRVATYTGQFGFFMIDPPADPARYDQELFLALHDWDPYISGGDDGFQMVMYNHASVNGRLLGAGDPIRVREGERVLFHVLNASATDMHWLALPGHQFAVTALDGNAVPTPAAVRTLRLGPGERIDAVVTMNQPGVWVLGECTDRVRKSGMGVVVEYANRSGEPQWTSPGTPAWDYRAFGRSSEISQAAAAPTTPDSSRASAPAQPIPMVFRSEFHGHGDFEHWTINGKGFPDDPPIMVSEGKRYRLVFDNRSTDDHPVHLHRHRFEVVAVNHQPTAGVLKDVVVVLANTTLEVEFVADNPGKTLFHCHMQDHMDFGFMQLFEYA